jgi:hypothetical protein
MRTPEGPYYLPLALSPGAERPKVNEDGVFDLAIRMQAPFKRTGFAIPVLEGQTAFNVFAEQHEDLWDEKVLDEGWNYCEPYALPITLLELLSHMDKATWAGK